MMPINNLNNDQNINRVYTKMSEDFSVLNNSNAKLSNSVQTVNYFNSINHSDNTDNSNSSCDHMYTTNAENDINPHDSSCQTAESEVRFLKEWLMLHLDLIQQQNDEILDKEKTILILQQENEMLKERINCMERGSPFQPSKFFKNSPKYDGENLSEDMTQNSSTSDEDNKNNIRLLDLNCDNGNSCSLELSSYELKSSESQLDLGIKQSCSNKTDPHFEFKTKIKLENGIIDTPGSELEYNICSGLNETNFSENNSPDSDPMKTLKTTIRRKRLCSGSSLLSNNDSAPETDTKRTRKLRKKRKRYLKDEQVLTTSEHYVTLTGDINPSRDQELAVEMATAAASNLEVPRWRIKVYGSCYTMEGTENLDDEVYNKRHSRLEIDERRRKRWDVQRIREQRVIEKLKQRQERIESGSKTDNNQSVHSFSPRVEDIRFLNITEQLPVNAFGCPIPKRAPSDFSLPWLNVNNSNIQVKKLAAKKTTSRRRTTKR